MNYRVDVLFWTRSWDGDDWITSENSYHYDTLQEAMEKAQAPYKDTKGLIESKIYSIVDGKRSADFIYKKDFES
jgi:hypothetical protein